MNNEPEIRITRHSLDRVTDWLRREMPAQAKNHMINFFAKIVLALIVAGILHVLMIYFVLRMFMSIGDGGPAMLLLPLVPLGIAFIVQAFVHRSTHGVMMVRGQRVHFVDDRAVIANDDEGVNPVRWLLFPAWIFFTAFESLARALHLMRARPALCAEVLAGIAAADRRAPIAEIEMQYDDENLPQTVRGLLALPGVIVTSREFPCLMLSSDLTQTVRSML